MEEALQALLGRFYLILSNMRFGLLLVTDDNRVEFANPSFCDIFGLAGICWELTDMTAREMIGKIRSSYRDPRCSGSPGPGDSAAGAAGYR